MYARVLISRPTSSKVQGPDLDREAQGQKYDEHLNSSIMPSYENDKGKCKNNGKQTWKQSIPVAR